MTGQVSHEHESTGDHRRAHRRRPGRGIRWSRAIGVVTGTLVVFGAVFTSPVSAATDPVLGYDVADTGSLSAISRITGAQAMWNNGFTGQGVGVAVIDTGVARVPGLDRAGKVIDGPDLSLDSQQPALLNVDAFGHGTHIAGIIAGSDVASGTRVDKCKTCFGPSAYTDTTKFVGIAPDANIVNVKVGAFDGAVDVSQVIAGIDWVVQHRNDPGLNIRVLNLSYGTDSVQPAQVDPLAFAVEAAWRAGVVVVVAGGNDGQTPGPLADPASSPAIIAVGATDPGGTLDTRDDVVADFASHGTADRPVDLAAPGVSVLSLRVPNGFVDQNVTTGKVGSRFQRASGTSQSTAVVSGLSALILSKYPTATPDVVKALLKSGAGGMLDDGKHKEDHYKGAGAASIESIASDPVDDVLASMAPILSVPTGGNGLGTLEAARGTFHLSSNGVTLAGEVDIFGKHWNAATMSILTSLNATWLFGTWNGSKWIGFSLFGAPRAIAWSGNDWTGARWSDARWTDTNWDGGRWSGARWSGGRWSSGTWTGGRWSGGRWSDNSWG
jgi:serine protease AprX